MKGTSPQKHSLYSWVLIGLGALLAVAGAALSQNYEAHFLLIVGGLLILCGIVWHLAMVRCPNCGHSLAGYRPLPGECPCCHKKFQ